MHKSNVTQLLKQCLLAVILLTNVMVIAQPGGGPPPGRSPRGFKPPAGAKPPFDMNDPNQQQKKKTDVATFTVSGVLEKDGSTEKLMYANVGVLNKLDSTFVRGASTDEKGKFVITGVPSGEYFLRISSLGFQNTFHIIKVPNGNIDLGVIKIKEGATTLDAVVIKEKKPMYAADGEKTMYNVSEDPSIQSGTTADALQNAPGVEVDIEGNVTLRGVSSVEIWINDKPSRLNEENLKTYIQQLPANALERIEVITNPSARYGSKTDGGVINIVTTAHIKHNSFTSFGVRAASQPNVSPWISYMWANEKFSFNVYAGLRYSKRESENNGSSTSFDMTTMDTASYQEYTSESLNKSLSGNIFLNASYNIDSMNTISFWGGFNRFGNNTESFENRMRQERGFEYEYTTENNSKSNNTFGHYGLNYEHKFNNEGHRIMADFSGNISSNNSNSMFIRNYLDTTFSALNLNQDKNNNGFSNTVGLDVDYSYPYSENGEIEAGISTLYSTDNSLYSTDTLVWGTDERKLDSLRFKDAESISKEFGAYFTLRHQFGNFTAKAGLRAEYQVMDYMILNKPEDNVTGLSYFNLNPSLHLSYRTQSMHNFSLSYTRRISNPSPGQLTTFITYNEDSYSKGNPLLEAAYTNSFEGGWTKFFENFGSVGVSAYHRNITNQVNTLTTAVYSDIFGRYVNYSMPVNLGSSHSTGAEFRVTYRPAAFVNVRFYANMYDSYYEYLEGDVLKSNESFSYSFNLNVNAKLWNKFNVYASGRYRSPTQSLYAENKATYNFDCGVRADFFKRKLSIHISVWDLFNWNKQENIINNPYYTSYNSNKVVNSRSISAGLTFRFGKMELENRAKTGEMAEL